ncbi:hypothetical protein CCACVL1_30518 [Corchorus capsularis]|uniref:Rhamnogalacturonan endolyase n=1 Tax=Corchorus capsularis TaxID=210143 RepID=A0A1R3FX54_COCAP|nr:hypothetical protein CCACVL1_30518 [Corchorus capsularis]
MAAALSNLSRLSIQDGDETNGARVEENRVVIADADWLDGTEEGVPRFHLLGKLFSKRRPNVEGLRMAMFQGWKLDGAMIVKEAGDNLYVFQFEDAVERDWVLVNQPWSFNRSLLVLREFDGLQTPEEVNFEICPVWMRVFKLPILMMTDKVGVAIGSVIGDVLEVDKSNSRYLRIRVRFNVNNPLLEGTTVTTPHGDIETHGQMIRKYSDYLRAETPDIKPRHFHTAISCLKSGGVGGVSGSRLIPARQPQRLSWRRVWGINTLPKVEDQRVDASFCSSTLEAGLGVVVRSSEGEVLVSAAKHIGFVSNSLYAEVHAILFGIEIALEYDIQDCIIESDCLIAVTEINNKTLVWWEGGVLIYEIRELVSLFDRCSIVHAHREANLLAHRLAHIDVDFVRMETQHFNVITQTDDIVELSFSKTWNSDDRSVRLNIDKRFVIRRGVAGIHTYAILERRENFPSTYMSQMRLVFKLLREFNFMALSDSRQTIMPSENERKQSPNLGFKEAVVLSNNTNDTQLRGEVDDKYQFSYENKDNKLHGWIADSHKLNPAVGFWLITPSNEFRNGGPHKLEIASHMFSSTHYVGREMETHYEQGKPLKKVLGPVFIYLNSASIEDSDVRKTLWQDAKRQLSEEIASWPYNFTRSKDFPYAEGRGNVTGELIVRDRQAAGDNPLAYSAASLDFNLIFHLQKLNNQLQQLAPPGEAGSWQTDTKGYQFWTQNDKHGRFEIKHVRPGEYNLYAWVPGFIGDYKLNLNITIQPGKEMDFGALIYDSPRNGPTLWEIGIPDRTAAEFFIPDPYPTRMNRICKDPSDRLKSIEEDICGIFFRDILTTVESREFNLDLPRREILGSIIAAIATTVQCRHELSLVLVLDFAIWRGFPSLSPLIAGHLPI